MTTEKARARGRPRRFDPEDAVATAQRLFHARGYDAVTVAEVTEALGINPPSFYAAFDSKAGLYARILDRYADAGAVPTAWRTSSAPPCPAFPPRRATGTAWSNSLPRLASPDWPSPRHFPPERRAHPSARRGPIHDPCLHCRREMPLGTRTVA